MVFPKVVDVRSLRKILNDPVMLRHERGAAQATIATRVGVVSRDWIIKTTWNIDKIFFPVPLNKVMICHTFKYYVNLKKIDILTNAHFVLK